MLRLNNISKVYYPGEPNQQTALVGINLSLKKGDFLTIIGSNGAGKSTLLNIIAGDIEPDAGSISFSGTDITKLPAHRRAAFVGRVFQDPLAGTAAEMSIAENLALARARGQKRGLNRAINKNSRQEFSRILKTLGLGLETRLDEPVGLLSGGQRQALTLLMAVLGSPKILLLDEYIAALDPQTAQEIIKLTGKIVKELDLTVLMVTHDLNQALKTGTRTIMMDRGEIILDIDAAQRKKLTVPDLLERFARVRGRELSDDRILLQAR